MFVVGLTGGIGCGKTAVSDAFAARGIAVVDTDIIAHALTGPHAAGSRALAHLFGPDILQQDGSLDRVAMRRRVFGDARARQDLEAVLHPLIREEAERQLQTASGPYALLVVPLLAQSPHFQALCQHILVVDCAQELQIERVMRRSGLQRQEVEAIMAAQASRELRLAIADDVIDNSGKLEQLNQDVQELHERYLQRADLRKTRE